MTQKELEELLKVKHAIDKAEDDDTPYAGVVDDKIVVSGDVNNTKVVKHDYIVKFILPEDEWKDVFPDEPKKGGYIITDIEFKDVNITPRQQLKVTSAMAQVFPMFKKLKEDGDVENLSDAEAVDMFQAMDDSVIDGFYRLVAVALEVDEKMVNYMAVSSVMQNTIRIIQDFPNAVNEADLFFA